MGFCIQSYLSVEQNIDMYDHNSQIQLSLKNKKGAFSLDLYHLI